MAAIVHQRASSDIRVIFDAQTGSFQEAVDILYAAGELLVGAAGWERNPRPRRTGAGRDTNCRKQGCLHVSGRRRIREAMGWPSRPRFSFGRRRVRGRIGRRAPDMTDRLKSAMRFHWVRSKRPHSMPAPFPEGRLTGSATPLSGTGRGWRKRRKSMPRRSPTSPAPLHRYRLDQHVSKRHPAGTGRRKRFPFFSPPRQICSQEIGSIQRPQAQGLCRRRTPWWTRRFRSRHHPWV